jgi:hypothetical protein
MVLKNGTRILQLPSQSVLLSVQTVARIVSSLSEWIIWKRARCSACGRDEIFRTCPDRPWGPPSLLYNGYWDFPGGKAAGVWFWPPAPSSAEVKRVWSYTSTPPPLWGFRVCYGVLLPLDAQREKQHWEENYNCYTQYYRKLTPEFDEIVLKRAVDVHLNFRCLYVDYAVRFKKYHVT